MKLIVPFALLLSIGLILAAGCVTPTGKSSVNLTTSPGFTPFSHPPDPGINKSINKIENNTSTYEGSLRVSISGISNPANVSVVVDNRTVGIVTPTKPLYLLISEGNHTVLGCVGPVCEQENVMIRFGKYVNVDFSERLQRDVKFPDPSARPSAQIIEYYKNGNVVSVDVEIINPESDDHTMSVFLSVGYAYIDSRSQIKLGDSAQAMTVESMKAGQRLVKRVDIHLSGDSIVSFDSPVIVELKVK
jgi:hypothetical protein